MYLHDDHLEIKLVVLYCIVLYCIVLYCIVLYDTAETVYQSCQADARVCKCSMDSSPETRPNPTRECSAMSNEADTRATRQRL